MSWDSDNDKGIFAVKVISDLLDEHVINNIPELPDAAAIGNDLKCRVCVKLYKRPKALAKHELNKHSIGAEVEETETCSGTEDKVKNYTRQLLIMLLLTMNHNDAIKHGDGERVLRLYFCLYSKVSNCPKYALAMLHLQAQVNCLLSPRLAHSLTWNRFLQVL